MPRLDPREQGDEDFLCGLYSVINGCLHLAPDLTEPQVTALFRSLGRALYRDGRLLETLTEGGGGEMLSSLLDAAVITLKRHGHTLVSAAHQIPKDSPWSALRDLSAQTDISVLVALYAPSGGHWTVVRRVGRRKLHLFDSNGYGPIKLVKCGFGREADYRLSRRVWILRRV